VIQHKSEGKLFKQLGSENENIHSQANLHCVNAALLILYRQLSQGWVFAMAKTIFARTVEKMVKTVAKPAKTGKNCDVRNIVAALCGPIL